MLRNYKKLLGYPNHALFLNNYLSDPALQRLKGVGYFCGMDYASKNIYDFSEYISRYDHSLTVALLVYLLTKDKTMAIAGLYHDIATPCFSHVIDYMNKDYLTQTSTEQYTEEILQNDGYLQARLKKDGICLEDVINYKRFSIVDNDRPKICADRLDAIILNSIGWLKNISLEEISEIISDLIVAKNELSEDEIAFQSEKIAKKALWFNDEVNRMMHSNEDIFMMQLLADIIKYSINRQYITELQLYTLSERELLNILQQINDGYLREKLLVFHNIHKGEIPNNISITVKNRNLAPLVRSRRISEI